MARTRWAPSAPECSSARHNRCEGRLAVKCHHHFIMRQTLVGPAKERREEQVIQCCSLEGFSFLLLGKKNERRRGCVREISAAFTSLLPKIIIHNLSPQGCFVLFHLSSILQRGRSEGFFPLGQRLRLLVQWCNIAVLKVTMSV